MNRIIQITKPEMLAFGKRLAAARHRAGIPQEQLAFAVGIDGRSLIGHYERGASFPSLPVFAAICRELGVTMEDIYHGNPELDSFDRERSKEDELAARIAAARDEIADRRRIAAGESV